MESGCSTPEGGFFCQSGRAKWDEAVQHVHGCLRDAFLVGPCAFALETTTPEVPTSAAAMGVRALSAGAVRRSELLLKRRLIPG